MSETLETTDLHRAISSTEEIIAEAQAGRMFILVDDEDRENEGDLIVPAQFATPQVINFMLRHARGLICLALTRQRVEQLGLPMMATANGQRHQTAFTASIDAREGVSSGVTARDRAHTIAVAINPEAGAADLVSPGHVFPLAARDGGTLVRAGHTEAAVDIARMAGLNPAGVICEIMNEDGSMARLPDLVAFARRHGLRLGTIANLIAHRRRQERLVRRLLETETTLDTGTWRVLVYGTTLDASEHLVLVKGDLAAPGPVLVRMQAVDPLGSIPGGPASANQARAMRMIAEAGRGVVVVLHHWYTEPFSGLIGRQTGGPERRERMLRAYGIGAQILGDLGVRDMILLSNTDRTIVGLEGYALNLVERRPLFPAAA